MTLATTSSAGADDVGAMLRRARLVAGMTQAAAARGIISASELSRIERGQRSPSGETFGRLAARLGLTIDALDAAPTSASRLRRPAFERGATLLAQQDWVGAERLGRTIMLAPADRTRRAQALQLRARAWAGMGEPDVAVAQLRQALHLVGSDAPLAIGIAADLTALEPPGAA